MTLDEFSNLVAKMRQKQREFHDKNRRTGSSCQDAVALERQVDRALADLARPLSLFDSLDREPPRPSRSVMIAVVDDETA